jgi:iron(III) transport system ATP-binding protein
MRVTLRNLTKRFGPTAVLRDVSLEVAEREFFFLLGPSGCGKTTLLRLIAGFYEADQGEVRFGDRRMDGVPPHHRNTGLVFQNYALWPHLTVAENVGYGLEVRGLREPEKRDRIREGLAIVRMEAFADRSPNQLSGGQQQRVALARALVIRPDVLLLDEPLSNLDARLRLEMRDEIRRIHDQTRITTLYVTHDQKEALSMADRMAVLRDGRIEQIGSPREVYRQPANRFVADFIGEANWIPGCIVDRSAECLRIETAVGMLEVQHSSGNLPTDQVEVGFRPEAVRFGPADRNGFQVEVEQSTYLGETEQHQLRLSDGTRIKALEQNPPRPRGIGEQTEVHIPMDQCFALPNSPKAT